MELAGKVVVVTGAAGGIGSGMCARFEAEGATVVGADRAAVGGIAGRGIRACDVTDAYAVKTLVDDVVGEYGGIDLFCSNAGITTGVALDDPDDLWHMALEINTMAHVYAARAVVPHMIERGSGYLLNTASAAGLLTSPGDAPYAVSKHGAVAFAEWLAITYGDRGIRVSVLCPMGVATPMLMDPLAAGDPGAQAVANSGDIVSVDHVVDHVIAGLRDERFLILPHPEVGTFWAQKAAEPDRWLAGMRRLVNR
jgi:NAD(P)-dependent dehydrogenase (short-subunit alcohol dehydrogenase family)